MARYRSDAVDRAALVVAAVAGTAAGLAAADTGVVLVAVDVAEWAADRGPVVVARTALATVGAVSAAHLPATAVAVSVACAAGTLRVRDRPADKEGWSVVVWRYGVAAVLVVALTGAVATSGALSVVLWNGYATLAALYLAEAWRGATRYPAPAAARWVLAASAAVPALLVGFRGQYRRTALAPLYGSVHLPVGEVPALAFAAGLPAVALSLLNTAALARLLGE